MRLFKMFGGKALAVALGLARMPASIAIPQSAPIAGPVVGVSEAQAQYYRGGHRGYHHGGRHWRGDRGYYRHHRRSNRNAAIGGAVAGLALGAIIAGAASQPRYVERRYVPVQPGGHHVGYRPAPWTAEWYRYCSQRYRSFDARSGTFQPYHGPRQLCR